MNLDDLRDQLKESFQTVRARVQESTAWIQLSEKFQNLTPSAQRAVLAVGSFFIVLLLLSIPWSYYSASSDAVVEFEDKRGLIRDLFRVSRASAILESAPASASPSELRSLAQNALQRVQLQADQIKSVTDFDNASSSPSPAIPKNVIQKGVSVSVSKLNLKQLVDLGHQLQTLHESAKMVGLEITANREDGHYFDVVYQIISFSLPAEPTPKVPPKKGASSGKAPPSDNEDSE